MYLTFLQKPPLCPVDSIVLLVEIMPAVCHKAKMASAFDPDWKNVVCHSIHMTLCLMPIKAWYGKSCRSLTASTLREIWAGKSPTQIQLANLHIPSAGPKIRPLFISESQNPMKHSITTSNATSFIKFRSRPPRTPPSGLLQVKPSNKPQGTY